VAKRRSKISAGSGELTLSRMSNPQQPKLVYALITNKSLRYPYGRSKVAYLGTTQRGIKRITESVAEHAEDILGNHGVTKLSTKFFTCRGRRRVRMWKKLERALIIAFREQYGAVPRYNHHGRGWNWGDELEYFSEAAVRSLVRRLG
jgi:hypothetical protein